MAKQGLAGWMSRKQALAPQATATKRAKVDPMVVGVMEAIEKANGLNDSCKAMLQAACPLALALPPNKRHNLHRDVVDMIGDTLETSMKKLETSVGVADVQVTDLEMNQSGLTNVLRIEEEKLKVATETVQKMEQEVMASVSASKSAEDSLSQRLQEQMDCDQRAKVLAAEKVSLESAVEHHLKPIQQEEIQGAEAQKHAQALHLLAESLALDEALLVSVPQACVKSKTSRGAFDVMVLDALGEAFRTHLATIEEQLSAQATMVTARAAAVADALCGVNVATAARTSHSAMVKEAVETETAQSVRVAEASTALLSLEVDIEKAKLLRDASIAAVDEFKTWPLECFTMLKGNDLAVEAGGA